jgi:hypothetical protein
MRCFFLKNGHIVSVELLPGLTDKEAVAKSHRLFAEAPAGRFDGFEVWEKERHIMRYGGPGPNPNKSNGEWHQPSRANDG